MNPSFVLRTEALREVTTFAAEDTEHGSAALQEMLEQVTYKDMGTAAKFKKL